MAMVTRSGRTPAQMVAMLFGAVFLLVGVAGFIPGITTDYDRLNIYDAEGAKLLGIFGVNWIHNMVHILFGLAGLSMAMTHRAARSFLLGGGVLYLALWVYGIAIDIDSSANFVALNTTDNWLHLALGAGMVIAGAMTASSAMGSTMTTRESFDERQRRAG